VPSVGQISTQIGGFLWHPRHGICGAPDAATGSGPHDVPVAGCARACLRPGQAASACAPRRSAGTASPFASASAARLAPPPQRLPLPLPLTFPVLSLELRRQSVGVERASMLAVACCSPLRPPPAAARHLLGDPPAPIYPPSLSLLPSCSSRTLISCCVLPFLLQHPTITRD